MAKYTLIAFLLWLFLGLFGAHHFYLGRDHHGLLWLTSFGGMLGIGWLRDFIRIPSYVREANEHPEFIMKMRMDMRKRRRPSIWGNRSRVLAGVMFGLFYRFLVLSSLPEEYATNSVIVMLLAPLGTAFGTYLVGNVGAIRSHWKYGLAGAYLGEALFGYHHVLLEHAHPSLAVSVSMLFSMFAWEFDRRPRALRLVSGERCRCCKRMALWTLVFIVFISLLVSSVYFNATITTDEGETIKVREAINNFFKSPHWDQLKKSFWANVWDIWEEYKKGGWEAAHRRFMIFADFQGEERSRLVLGVDADATYEEVKARYRKLAKEWHPDLHQGVGPEEKVRVQDRFMEIKEAYETLQKLYKSRESRMF
jgi:DnaJ family protein C protein 22